MKATTIGTWSAGAWRKRPWPAVPPFPSGEVARCVLRPSEWQLDEERVEGIAKGLIPAPAEVSLWCALALESRGDNEKSVSEATREGGGRWGFWKDAPRISWTWTDADGWRGVIAVERCPECARSTR